MSYDNVFRSEFVTDLLYRPLELPFEAVSSSVWAYPFIGIYYFLSRPDLWSYALSIAIPQALITTTVFIFIHVWFYPPQAIVAMFFNGPTGLITTWIAILHQSGLISRYIIERTILPEPLRNIFDSVVRQNGSDKLVAKVTIKHLEEQRVKTTWQQNLLKWAEEWDKAIRNPYYWVKFAVIVFFNLVPFFGPYILIFLRSPGKGRALHSRYYAIKKFTPEQSHAFFNANRAQYTSFGIVALNLELIPIIGMFFTFTNIVAAALWAVDLEKQEEKRIEANKLK